MMRWAIALILVTATLAGCAKPHPFEWPEPMPGGCDGAVGGGLRCELLITGLTNPVQALGRDGILYVVEQHGQVLALRDGVPDHVFLDISDRISTCHFEQGLLGLAFDPAYPVWPAVYATYTAKQSCSSNEKWKKGDLVVARFVVRDGIADADSEERLLVVPEPYRNHNGGHLLFGPDGMLYLGVGDGGDHGDPLDTGRSPRDLLGSILRIDVSGSTGYTVPADNPFVGNRAGADEVWLYGLRNPWRFAFDARGELWIADVGQDCFEEINRVPAGTGGLDLGWSDREGDRNYALAPSAQRGDCTRDASVASGLAAGTLDPVFVYAHGANGCSITGGPYLEGEPAGLRGYLFSDFCTGIVWILEETEGGYAAREVLRSNSQITSFGSDDDGGLYLLHWGGDVYRLVPDAA